MAETKTIRAENMEEAVKEMVQKKRKAPPMAGNNGFSPIIGDNGIHVKPGDNSKYAQTLLDMCQDDPVMQKYNVFETYDETLESLLALRHVKVDKNDISTMAKRVIGYLAWCVANDERVTNLMMYARIGVSKDDAWNWGHGYHRGPEYKEFMQTVLSICSAARELLASDGKLSPVTLIWWQKNYDGYTDNQTVTIVNGNQAIDETNKEEIAAKYLDAIPIEVKDVNE